MNILVINSGSSSIKAAVLDPAEGKRLATLKAERVNTPNARWQINEEAWREKANADHDDILSVALPELVESLPASARPKGVGHRVVHGGEHFSRPVRITEEVLTQIEALSDLAPLHNPPMVAGIRVARRLWPEMPHIAVFDTAFHGTLPRRAQHYAIPTELAQKHGVRRFGFHGPSHEFVAKRAAEFLNADTADLRLITCHLGNGASVCAVEYGRSVETSMGTTPLEGLVMGTRSGDIDPGAILRIARREGWDLARIDTFLNKESGLAGLSDVGNDMRDIEERAGQGDEACRLAIQVFAHRVRKYIGAYAAVMGGVDAIVFTAGIGQNSALIRHRIVQRFGFLGARLDEDRNRDARVSHEAPVAEISDETSRVRILTVATDEERQIAQHAAALVADEDRVKGQRTIPIAISARHVHLTQESVEALFGKGHQLTPYRPLSQPGQFASEEKVNLIGPKRRIDGVRVLGPTRSADQVEVSRTDEFHLGLDAPVRASGDIENTPGITLEGPAGSIQLKQGVICAWRHIHMTPEDAEHFGLEDKDVVEVGIEGTGRDLIFGDVLVRVKSSYKLEMHIDTDEGNAAELSGSAEGMLVETGGVARLRRKKPRAEAAE